MTDEKLNIHKDIIHQLDHYVDANTIPNILLYGQHGGGKKHLLNYLLDRIYEGVENREQYIMTVNCAFGKGIKFIREELKFFAKTNIGKQIVISKETSIHDMDENQDGKTTQKSKDIIKSIILLYGEHLTIDAQSALRRCIELFSHHTRFFIVVQDKTKLLLPILSRMAHIFVDIPYIKEEKAHINLHLYKKRKDPVITRRKNNILDKIFNKWRESKNPNSSPKDVIKMIHDLYERGITFRDILIYIRCNEPPSLTLYQYLMEMDNIRHNICDERMCMFIGLNKYVIRYLS